MEEPRYHASGTLKRVYLFDVLTCACGRKRALIAVITDPATCVKILSHLGLAAEPPQTAPARNPPSDEASPAS